MTKKAGLNVERETTKDNCAWIIWFIAVVFFIAALTKIPSLAKTKL